MAIRKSSSSSDAAAQSLRSAAEIEEWLVKQVSEELQVAPDTIQIDQPLLAQGVDSMHIVAIIAKLEDWLGIRFTSDPLEDAPSIAALAQRLAAGEQDHRPAN